MNTKQMPYKIPDGFIEESKIRNRAAVARAARMQKSASSIHRRHVILRWAAPAAAAVVLAAAAIWYTESVIPPHSEMPGSMMEQLIAQMNNASDEVILEIACDTEDYPEDLSTI